MVLNGSLETELKETISQLNEDIKLQEEFLKDKDTAVSCCIFIETCQIVY